MLHGRTVRRVISGEQLTDAFEVQLGVAQGAVTSPYLFAIFINELLVELRREGSGVCVDERLIAALACADDLVLLAATVEGLQRLLDVVTGFARDWKIVLSASKNEVVVHGGKRDKERAAGASFVLQGMVLQVVPEYKYLGVELGCLHGWSSVVRRLLAKAQNLTANLKYVGCRHGGFSVSTAFQSFNTLVRPAMEYGVEVWCPTQAQLKKLESVRLDYTRAVLGCSGRTPSDFLLCESGQRSFASRADEL
jgi:hypothetical protein